MTHPTWSKPRRKTWWRTYEAHIQTVLFIALFNWAWIADLKGW